MNFEREIEDSRAPSSFEDFNYLCSSLSTHSNLSQQGPSGDDSRDLPLPSQPQHSRPQWAQLRAMTRENSDDFMEEFLDVEQIERSFSALRQAGRCELSISVEFLLILPVPVRVDCVVEKEKLVDLNENYSIEVSNAGTHAFFEINECNPRGRYIISEMWNYEEGRRRSYLGFWYSGGISVVKRLSEQWQHKAKLFGLAEELYQFRVRWCIIVRVPAWRLVVLLRAGQDRIYSWTNGRELVECSTLFVGEQAACFLLENYTGLERAVAAGRSCVKRELSEQVTRVIQHFGVLTIDSADGFWNQQIC
ncbi:WEB family protein chloroplastic [Dorcoceras hygrometricum]|uniref:WEB family protein chloroplastic n=1 Tax=Dorcoceras hygrometricum TaxID=472368 RepID=A0A2Z7BG57_9LAMI|nr:WEB family protein chloroplastic [Dorcoceras hygrometricum]